MSPLPLDSDLHDRSSWMPPYYGDPLLVVLSGPTAVGKTTVLRRMRELGLPYHIGVTATTRPPRADEVDGHDYIFTDTATFRDWIATGELLEWAEVHGAALYGIPRAGIRAALAAGKDVIVPPEPKGAATVRAAVPGTISIFMAPPTFDDLDRRIRVRNSEKSEEEIQRRLATAQVEMRRIHEFDYLVINESQRVDDTAQAIHAIIQAERHRVNRPGIEL